MVFREREKGGGGDGKGWGEERRIYIGGAVGTRFEGFGVGFEDRRNECCGGLV